MAKQLNNFPTRRSARLQQRKGDCLGGLQSTLVEEKFARDPVLILNYRTARNFRGLKVSWIAYKTALVSNFCNFVVIRENCYSK